MVKIERILNPTDFSDFSIRAYAYAQSIARRYQSKLHVMHVTHSPFGAYPSFLYTEAVASVFRDLRAHAEQELREFVKDRPGQGVKPEYVVIEGAVTDAILQFAEEKSMDLIVMGTHGRRGLDRIAMGSVAEKVLRKAHCPVLAVRKPPEEAEMSPGKTANQVEIKKILHCTDFSEHSKRAAEYACSLAAAYGAEISLLHVLEGVSDWTDIPTATAEVEKQLTELIPSGPNEQCKMQMTVRIGKPYEKIVQYEQEAQIDLVVLGVRGRNALDLALFGSTTQRVLQLGSCPVLTVNI